ncbi:MAG: hypothetical protein J07HQX50_00399 [Haloquadratum sp. J07HQX50]|nr:MAG: hypothetical protein J07HQX50_00399 [Haloquadratum sp. J07HQX50]
MRMRVDMTLKTCLIEGESDEVIGLLHRLHNRLEVILVLIGNRAHTRS